MTGLVHSGLTPFVPVEPVSGVFYRHSGGYIICLANHRVRTVAEAEAAIPHMADIAITAPTDELAERDFQQLCDLIRATREARAFVEPKLELAA